MGSSVIDKAGRNAVVTALMVCCGYIVCVSPLYIFDILTISGVAVDFGSWYYNFTGLLMLTNSVFHLRRQVP